MTPYIIIATLDRRSDYPSVTMGHSIILLSDSVYILMHIFFFLLVKTTIHCSLKDVYFLSNITILWDFFAFMWDFDGHSIA